MTGFNDIGMCEEVMVLRMGWREIQLDTSGGD